MRVFNRGRVEGGDDVTPLKAGFFRRAVFRDLSHQCPRGFFQAERLLDLREFRLRSRRGVDEDVGEVVPFLPLGDRVDASGQRGCGRLRAFTREVLV